MKLKVDFFNAYVIKLDEDHWLDFNIINSPKLAKLLAYIIYHHRRKLSSNDLQELMFASGESNNPANALKALIYRLRTILKNNLGEYDYILSSQGTYYWNPEIEMIFDVDDFTLYHRLGRNEIHDEEIRAKYYMKAYYRYSGEFLPMIENVEKLSIIRGFLNSQFLNVSRFLIEFYLKKEEYGIIEEICMKNLADNYLDENINAILVLALVKQDKITLAKEHYNKVTSALKDDLGNATIRKMKYYLNYNVNNAEERNIFSSD